MDIITLENMRFISHSGVLEEEKKDGQHFVVTLSLEISDIPGCRTDDLRDTVDYSRVFSITRDYVENTSCDLIEYMSEQIIIRVLRAFSMIEACTCQIKKPMAPIDGNFDSMNVTIRRTREQLESML